LAASSLEIIAKIQQLNLQIVEARKQGDDQRVKALKQQVTTLMQAGLQKTSPSEATSQAQKPTLPKPPIQSATNPSTTAKGRDIATARKATPAPKSGLSTQEAYQRLRELNEQIVLARRSGSFDRMKSLQGEVNQLLERMKTSS